jgi:cation diffusion facilitator CzcD-associated flavoprotein CzcO
MSVNARRIGSPSLEALLGRGVFYGAAVAEAKSMRGRKAFVVGSGNSAGQAVLHAHPSNESECRGGAVGQNSKRGGHGPSGGQISQVIDRGEVQWSNSAALLSFESCPGFEPAHDSPTYRFPMLDSLDLRQTEAWPQSLKLAGAGTPTKSCRLGAVRGRVRSA